MTLIFVLWTVHCTYRCNNIGSVIKDPLISSISIAWTVGTVCGQDASSRSRTMVGLTASGHG